jgi:hypothetical protein
MFLGKSFRSVLQLCGLGLNGTVDCEEGCLCGFVLIGRVTRNMLHILGMSVSVCRIQRMHVETCTLLPTSVFLPCSQEEHVC